MKDLQDIWNEIPEKSLDDDEIKAMLNRRSISEVGRFKRLLLVELYASWGLAFVVPFFHETIGKEITAMIYVTVFLGSILNIITLRKIKKLQLLDDVRSFLKRAIKALKAFVTGFILTIQLIGVFIIAATKFSQPGNISWMDWLLSEQGITVIILFLIIEAILIAYAMIFYVRRIHSLRKILREMEN